MDSLDLMQRDNGNLNHGAGVLLLRFYYFNSFPMETFRSILWALCKVVGLLKTLLTSHNAFKCFNKRKAVIWKLIWWFASSDEARCFVINGRKDMIRNQSINLQEHLIRLEFKSFHVCLNQPTVNQNQFSANHQCSTNKDLHDKTYFCDKFMSANHNSFSPIQHFRYLIRITWIRALETA